MFKFSLLFLAVLNLSILKAQSDASRLKMNRELMSGEWTVEDRIDFFTFKNDTSGVWSSIGIASKIPLFVTRIKDDRIYIIPITEEGKRTDPIEIRSIDQKKMVLYHSQTKEKIVLKKVAGSSE